MEPAFGSTNYGGNAPLNYQRFFVPTIGSPIAEDLLAVARLEPAQSVLDVACGTGVVTRLAAGHVGPKGKATGLDLNPGMLAVARSSTPEDPAIEWIEGDAAAMQFEDGGFDVVLCQMGLQFMPDKLAVLREMRRVLAPGGRIHVNLPGPRPPLFGVMADAIARHLGPEGAGFVNMVFSLYDPGELQDLFHRADFEDVKVEAKPKTLVVPPAREFLWQYIHSTPLAQQARNVEERVREALERDVCPEWEQLAVGDKMHFEVRMTTVSAVR